jgi:hypothetical protein
MNSIGAARRDFHQRFTHGGEIRVMLSSNRMESAAAVANATKNVRAKVMRPSKFWKVIFIAAAAAGTTWAGQGWSWYGLKSRAAASHKHSHKEPRRFAPSAPEVGGVVIAHGSANLRRSDDSPTRHRAADFHGGRV